MNSVVIMVSRAGALISCYVLNSIFQGLQFEPSFVLI